MTTRPTIRQASPTEASGDALAGPALRTFFRIAEAWGLTPTEQMVLLGDPPRSTFYKWREGGATRLSRDVLERISYVFGIYKALQILFPDPARADAWVRRPSDAPPFGGRSALARMLSGNVADLYVVRQYLDAERGGWP
jgi:hypothetical protein